MTDDKNTTDDRIGHNSGNTDDAGKVVWERWTRKRTFVRALEGTYGELKEELYKQPRVYKTSDLDWKGGPHNFGKKVINPQANRIAQSIEAHIDAFAPHGYGQTHGHMNSAVFFVLKGKGHDIHDGRRMDWEAGDALIVENACVHQHLSDSDDENHNLYSHGSDSGDMSFDFSFSSYNEVINVEIDSVECEINSVFKY